LHVRTYPRLDLDFDLADLRAALAFRPSPARLPALRKDVEAFWPGPRRPLSVLSVRTAFDLYLQALRLPAGAEVLMSAVTIENMAEIVRRHGLRPVPVDVDLSTLAPRPSALEAAATPSARILMIAHLYGALADLGPAVELCRRRGLRLVEDCAQAYSGGFYRGDDRADLSLFSFGPIKMRTALGGAVALVRDAELAGRMADLEACYPPYGERRFVRRLLKFAALKALSHPSLYGLVLKLLALAGRDPEASLGAAARGFGSGDLLAQIRRRPAARCLRLLARRLGQGGDPARAARARALLDRLHPGIPRPGGGAAKHAYWLVPILAREPDALCAALRAEGFDATRGTTSMRVVEAPGVDLPHASRLLAEVVYLPSTARVPDAELARLAELCNRFLGYPPAVGVP
jgi:perosamine synthetase